MAAKGGGVGYHKAFVKTLYRMILKEQLNWAVGRELWLQKALLTRAIFDKNKNLTDQGDIEVAIDEAKFWLFSNSHPDPYKGQHNTAQQQSSSAVSRSNDAALRRHLTFPVSLPLLPAALSPDSGWWLLLPTQRCASSLCQHGTMRTHSSS
jgi:NADH dehydrogenase (ubiquinone) 1 beta subcomplex subunit 9